MCKKLFLSKIDFLYLVYSDYGFPSSNTLINIKYYEK